MSAEVRPSCSAVILSQLIFTWPSCIMSLLLLCYNIQNQQLFRNYVIFSLLIKCPCGPDKMSLLAGLGPRGVLWRTLLYGKDHPSLPIFQCSPMALDHLTHTNQPDNSSSIQGFEHFIRSDFISAYSVLAERSSAAVMEFSSSNLCFPHSKLTSSLLQLLLPGTMPICHSRFNYWQVRSMKVLT